MYTHPWQPLGKALLDYFNGDTTASLTVLSDFELPVMMKAELFFRGPDGFPDLEQVAMRLCRGRVLDIGAGAGSHTLTLQELGAPVVAIDVSPDAVTVMKNRGVKDARCLNVFDLNPDSDLDPKSNLNPGPDFNPNTRLDTYNDPPVGKFDTLLMMMNGIGIVENLSGLERFFNHARKLVSKTGEPQIILDSLDLREVISDAEIAARMLDDTREYFGEVRYRLEYKGGLGQEYSWLYVDPDTLIEYANRSGWASDGIWQEEDGHYLAKLVLWDSK